jgi:uncharacterized membrane protein (UPF0127 family)
MIRWITVLALITLAIPGAGLAGPATPSPSASPFERGTLRVYRGARLVAELNVEVARTFEARAQGLMHRRSLPENAGMLFVFEDDGRWAFWMKNTYIPLSIGFIDRTWRLLEVLDMQPAADPAVGPWPAYEPGHVYRYALEVNQGYFARRGITLGDRFELVAAR